MGLNRLSHIGLRSSFALHHFDIYKNNYMNNTALHYLDIYIKNKPYLLPTHEFITFPLLLYFKIDLINGKGDSNQHSNFNFFY